MVKIVEVENDGSGESDLTEVPKFPLNQVLDTPKGAEQEPLELQVPALEEGEAQSKNHVDPEASVMEQSNEIEVRPHFFAQPVDDISELLEETKNVPAFDEDSDEPLKKPVALRDYKVKDVEERQSLTKQNLEQFNAE